MKEGKLPVYLKMKQEISGDAGMIDAAVVGIMRGEKRENNKS